MAKANKTVLQYKVTRHGKMCRVDEDQARSFERLETSTRAVMLPVHEMQETGNRWLKPSGMPVVS